MPKDDTLWILDFDRCLGDIDALYGRLQELIESRQVLPAGKLDQLRQQTEASGGSFDALSECKTLLTPEAYKGLISAYTDEPSGDEYLLPGAGEFLQWLGATEQPFMIMTYGQEEWQLAKLRRAGLGGFAYIVTPISSKAELIAAWQEGGEFIIPRDKIMNSESLPSKARQVVLVDDKAKAFANAPSDLRGYWIQAGALLPSQQGTVPSSITIVNAFQEIIRYESH